MAIGNWSFIQEWTIYEYINHRYEEGTLRFKTVFVNGNTVRKQTWCKVDELDNIIGTDFPDIKGIKLKGGNKRPAEIKFTTSSFDYHKNKKYINKYKKFQTQNGFILVLSHDYLPANLKQLDVYEIDSKDFITFCKENFERLLNRQMKVHTETKIWVMYQGPNFNIGNATIKSAKQSKIWCPTENLNSFDLAIGDRILFVKTKGASSQDVQNKFQSIKNKWEMTSFVIVEVNSKIRSRFEYCQLNNIPFNLQLWKEDPKIKNDWRWNRVFEFKIIKELNYSYLLSKLQGSTSADFLDSFKQVFCNRVSREISHKTYRNLLEILLK